MRSYTFESELIIPRTRREVFRFISDPRHLTRVMPANLGISVTLAKGFEMKAGAELKYRFRLRGVPIGWQGEVTVWEPPFCFVDVQRHGPFTFWSHEHIFVERSGVTHCIDRIHYLTPFFSWFDRVWVRAELERVFDHRGRRLAEHFRPRTDPDTECKPASAIIPVPVLQPNPARVAAA